MNIAVCFKVVPDDQDIHVTADHTLDYSKAKGIVSAYDLNAFEAAAQLGAAEGARVVAVTAGPSAIDDSKLKKNVLARGAEELIMIADDACANMDARATAEMLSAMLLQVGEIDLVVCGDGSADDYAQQVNVQLAVQLGWPVVNAVVSMTAEPGALVVERALEDVVETVRVPLPAVVAVTPDIALPRIPGMKDILAAGKKPMQVTPASHAPAASLETVSCYAPEQVQRKLKLLDAANDGAIETFAAALKAAL